jgi:preprotein translocase YajC subunit
MFAAIGFLVVLMVMQSRKRKKQAEELANSLAVGVWVMLTSGIYGEVVAVNEDRISLRAGDATLVVAKGAVLRTVDAPAEAAKPNVEIKKSAAAKVSAAKKPAAPKKPAAKQPSSKSATKTSK